MELAIPATDKHGTPRIVKFVSKGNEDTITIYSDPRGLIVTRADLDRVLRDAAPAETEVQEDGTPAGEPSADPGTPASPPIKDESPKGVNDGDSAGSAGGNPADGGDSTGTEAKKEEQPAPVQKQAVKKKATARPAPKTSK